MRGTGKTGGRARRFYTVWADTIGSILFPPRCLLCASILPPATVEPLCRRCRVLFAPGGLLCPQCEQFYTGVKSCLCSCPSGPLQGLLVLSFYEGEWRRMLHRLKYSGKRQLARPLGAWLGMEMQRQTGWRPDAVVPVPLHMQREAERGYNQALLIACHTARAIGVPLLKLLKKVRPIPSQTGLTRRERQDNVRGVFSYNGNFPCGQSVLLIDDIYSTGATLHEAAKILQGHGLGVYGAVAAYNRRLSGETGKDF